MQEYTYQELNDALNRVNIPADAAECHGALSAVICFMGDDGYNTWLESHLPELGDPARSGDALSRETAGMLDDWYRTVSSQLVSGDLTYHLLLPMDNADLGERTQAMSHWCQGFLLGLQYVGVTDNRRFKDELAEIIRDITEISQVTNANLEYSEEEEQSYTELVEYLRVGVMLFRELLYVQSTNSPSTVH